MDDLRAVFVLTVLVLPFAVFALLALRRRPRHRALASRLGAAHVDGGLFAPGTIAGPDFGIAVTRVGKGYRTGVQVTVGATPGTFWLTPGFFASFPDWARVTVPGTARERVFLWEIRVARGVAPSDAQRDELLRWLADAARLAGVHAALQQARIDQVVIADGTVATSFRGIVGDAARLERTLALLRQLPRGTGAAPAHTAPASRTPEAGHRR